jgi:heat shock protein HslJ
MNHAPILASQLLLALAAGCSSPRDDARAPDPAPADGAESEPVKDAPFEGTEWRLVDVGGKAAIPGQGARGAFVAFDREAATVRGNSGLNSFFGPYALDGAKLRIENLGMTRMAGSPELMAQEYAFGAALHAARSWRVKGDTLELLDGAGAKLAVLRAAAAS